jgi:hypothetical protein
MSLPFVEVLNVFGPLLKNEVVSYTTLLDSTYSTKIQDVEIKFQEDTCQLGDAAMRTRTIMDELKKSAMKEIEIAHLSRIQTLGQKETQLMQGYMATKNCITQEVHSYAMDMITSFRTFLASTNGTPPTTTSPSATVLQLVQLLDPSTPPSARIQFLETFMSSVLSSPFQLSVDTVLTIASVVMQIIQGKNKYAETLLAGHDENATMASFLCDPKCQWLMTKFGLQEGQVGADQLSRRQALGRFSYDLTTNVQFVVVLSLVLWYGEMYGRPLEVPSMTTFSVETLESLVRDDFGLLGLSRVGSLLRYYLPRGEGIKGYADLGCELLFSTEWKLYSMQFGDDPVITDNFTAVHVLRAMSNLVCGVGVFLHLAQLHHRFTDDLLYAFYSIPSASTHPLRCLIDPLGIGSANKNDSGLLSGYHDFDTLFGNFTMQSKRANLWFHKNTKKQTSTPVSWPDFVEQTLKGTETLAGGLVQDLWLWYNAFDEFVRMALLALNITEVDTTIAEWIGQKDLETLRRTLTEAYFNNVIHEVAGSQRLLQMLQRGEICTATRQGGSNFQSSLPSHMQQTGAIILVQATFGSTVRFHSAKNHPWSHSPILSDAVTTFQCQIGKIDVSSLVHPSRVETSIAW